MNAKITSEHARQLRAVVYYALPVLFFATTVGLTNLWSVREVVSEGGFVEVLQCVLLVLSTLTLLYYARSYPDQRAFLVLAVVLGVLALVREANNMAWHHQVFAFRTASSIFGLLVLSLVVWWFRADVGKQLWQAVRCPSFQFLAGGGIIVIGWAQTLAQRTLFGHALDDRAVEECLETAGYILISCGVFELHFDLAGLAGSSAQKFTPGQPDPRPLTTKHPRAASVTASAPPAAG